MIRHSQSFHTRSKRMMIWHNKKWYEYYWEGVFIVSRQKLLLFFSLKHATHVCITCPMEAIRANVTRTRNVQKEEESSNGIFFMQNFLSIMYKQMRESSVGDESSKLRIIYAKRIKCVVRYYVCQIFLQ